VALSCVSAANTVDDLRLVEESGEVAYSVKCQQWVAKLQLEGSQTNGEKGLNYALPEALHVIFFVERSNPGKNTHHSSLIDAISSTGFCHL
jgi:hypothetical protein